MSIKKIHAYMIIEPFTSLWSRETSITVYWNWAQMSVSRVTLSLRRLVHNICNQLVCFCGFFISEFNVPILYTAFFLFIYVSEYFSNFLWSLLVFASCFQIFAPLFSLILPVCGTDFSIFIYFTVMISYSRSTLID